MSIGTIHCQNTTGWNLSTGVGERVLMNGCIELLRTFLVEPHLLDVMALPLTLTDSIDDAPQASPPRFLIGALLAEAL